MFVSLKKCCKGVNINFARNSNSEYKFLENMVHNVRSCMPYLLGRKRKLY